MSKTDISKTKSKDITDIPPGFSLKYCDRYACRGIPSEKFQRRDFLYCTVEYVEKGRGFLETNGEQYDVNEGDVYILHHHSSHCYYPDKKDPWAKIYFSMSGTLVDYLWKAYSMESIHYIPDCRNLKSNFEKMVNLYSKQNVSINHDAAILFHKTVIELSEISRRKLSDISPAVFKIKNYFDRHVEKPLQLADACKDLGFSEGHLIRLFNTYMHETPYAYLIRLRMEHAKHLLINTNMYIKEISARLQFADPFYFSNSFKKYYGISPAQFRKAPNIPVN